MQDTIISNFPTVLDVFSQCAAQHEYQAKAFTTVNYPEILPWKGLSKLFRGYAFFNT